jgi:hypothetical protein
MHTNAKTNARNEKKRVRGMGFLKEEYGLYTSCRRGRDRTLGSPKAVAAGTTESIVLDIS